MTLVEGVPRSGPSPRRGRGVGIPSSLDWGGGGCVPPSSPDRGGTPSSSDWGGGSQVSIGYLPPPQEDRMGVPADLPPPHRRQSSTASTCYYGAGGMAIAFTQEDILVSFVLGVLQKSKSLRVPCFGLFEI